MKGFFKNFFTLFIGTGLNILISLVTVPIITRLVNPSEYGQLSFFNMYSNIAYIILLLGLDQAYVRFFYKSNEEIYKRGIFYSCLKWPIILTSIVSIFIVIFGRNMLQVEEKYTNIVLLIFILNLFSLILQRFVLLTLRLEMNTKLFSFLNVLSKIIYTILAITLILIIKKDYYLILIFSTFFSTFATVVIGILCKRKLYINKNISTKGINKIELLKYGYPFIFSSILSMGFQYADKLTIKHYGTYEDVGIYAGALNIISMFSIINNVFNTLWAPMSMEHYEKQPNNKEFFIKGNQFITVIMFFMAINMILFKDIISMFLDKQYRLAAYILPFLVFEPVMNTISETTVNGINFAKKSKMHIIITFCCCIVNVIGNVILIPKIGRAHV